MLLFSYVAEKSANGNTACKGRLSPWAAAAPSLSSPPPVTHSRDCGSYNKNNNNNKQNNNNNNNNNYSRQDTAKDTH